MVSICRGFEKITDGYCGRIRRRMELTLQNLEVLDVGVLGVDIKLHTRHRYVEEDAVEYLAEGSTV